MTFGENVPDLCRIEASRASWHPTGAWSFQIAYYARGPMADVVRSETGECHNVTLFINLLARGAKEILKRYFASVARLANSAGLLGFLVNRRDSHVKERGIACKSNAPRQCPAYSGVFLAHVKPFRSCSSPTRSWPRWERYMTGPRGPSAPTLPWAPSSCHLVHLTDLDPLWRKMPPSQKRAPPTRPSTRRERRGSPTL